MRNVITVVLLVVVVGGLYLLNDATRRSDGRSVLHVAKEVSLTVETVSPEEREIVRTVQAPGEVEAFDEVDISSEVVAKIIELPFEEGDYVQKGEVICRLDDADYRARVASAEASVAKLKAMIRQAEAELDRAQLDWQQIQILNESSATSEQELARYRTALVAAQALLEMRQHELVEAEAGLQSAREDLAKTVIRSPINGVVSQRFAEVGEVVVTGTMNNAGTRVMVISDLSKLQVRCRVDEADAPLAAVDQQARIYLQSDTRRSVPGKVLRICPKGSKQTGRDVVTFETLVLITGDDPRVKPGMTANVEIEVARRENAVTIPIESVVYRRRRDVPAELVRRYDEWRAARGEAASQATAEYIKLVFSVKDGKATPKLVDVGINDIARVEVLEGLSTDDTIVTGPYRSLDQLKDGAAVTLAEKPGALSAPADAAEKEKGAAAKGDAASNDAKNDASHQAAASQPADQATAAVPPNHGGDGGS